MLVSLSLHPRSSRGAERIRQDKGRWSRPSKTALERSNLTEKFQFQESHAEAETKKTPGQIPVLSKKNHYIHLTYICNVSERGYTKRSFQNTDDLHFSPSCSMVVTLHDHITSPVVFCNMYLFLIISDVRAPHRHGKIMVTTWLPVD